MTQRLPNLERDAEAETVVSSLDLAEYEVSRTLPVHVTSKSSKPALSVDLPKHLIDEVKTKAAQSGIPLQDFIQTAIERAILD